MADPGLDPFLRCKTMAGTTLLMAARAGLDLSSLFGETTNVNCQNGYGMTPLMEASAKGHQHAVLALLEAKSDVNMRCKSGWSALCHAAQGGQWAVALTLVEATADPNVHIVNPGQTPLILATQAGEVSLVRALVASRADVNFCSFIPPALTWASLAGSLPMVNCLLEARATQHIDNQDIFAMWYAAHQGCGKVVVRLLERSGPDRPRRPGWNVFGCRVQECALSTQVFEAIVSFLRGAVTEIPRVAYSQCTPRLVSMVEAIMRPWLPANHLLFPRAFREAVHTLLLVARRRCLYLPLTVILSFVGRHWWSA